MRWPGLILCRDLPNKKLKGDILGTVHRVILTVRSNYGPVKKLRYVVQQGFTFTYSLTDCLSKASYCQ